VQIKKEAAKYTTSFRLNLFTGSFYFTSSNSALVTLPFAFALTSGPSCGCRAFACPSPLGLSPSGLSQRYLLIQIPVFNFL
jgi:hypothetical protein